MNMTRIHKFKKAPTLTHKEINRKIAIHEAGHAAAIHLGNKQKNLPPVFFQIYIKPFNSDFQSSELLSEPYDNYIPKVKGGRLIHTLPLSYNEATKNFSTAQKLDFERAFEADIINLLAGPLAEANYIARRDDEPINPRLVDVNALRYYGGLSDLEIVNTYLECFIENDVLRERKINKLFLAAFDFINKRSNWLAITALAEYILAHDNNIIECEEIISVLDGVPRTAASHGGIGDH